MISVKQKNRLRESFPAACFQYAFLFHRIRERARRVWVTMSSVRIKVYHGANGMGGQRRLR